ncbi:MAG: hypothetical protein KatS3mg108_1685 [Isosphaeraceae bacterium]|jgi:hypothetical protein|nr:MAG: hypothetical protein KatS3mg108_1685 [Isosphaeraceae bacterium]
MAEAKQKNPQSQPKPQASKPEKAPKAEKAAKAEKSAPEPLSKPEPVSRPPADPRLKVMKKFQGRFLPRGPLRDRYQAILARWNSGEDHGGVTLEELKALLNDWRASRAKPARSV